MCLKLFEFTAKHAQWIFSLEISDLLRFDIWDLGASSVIQRAVLYVPKFYMFSRCGRDAYRINLLNQVCVLIVFDCVAVVGRATLAMVDFAVSSCFFQSQILFGRSIST